MLKNHTELRGFLEMIVYAKKEGMMDHREAKDLWLTALTEAGAVVVPSVGRRQG